MSIHRTGVTDSNGNWNEDAMIGKGGVGQCGQSTINSPQEFAVRTRINTDMDIADASQSEFFYQLFTRDVCYNNWANERVCWRKDCSYMKPALQEVNKRPCFTQQRVKSLV